MHKGKNTSKRKNRNADRRKLRRVLNRCGDFFTGTVGRYLIRSKYGAGVSSREVRDSSNDGC